MEVARSVGRLQPVEESYLEFGVKIINQLNASKPFSTLLLEKVEYLTEVLCGFLFMLLM